MPVELLKGEAVVEYFKDQVKIALEHQHVLVHELTEWYIVSLLASLRHVEKPSPLWVGKGTVAEKLAEALGILGGSKKAEALREVGDYCLMISGFWQGRLRRSLVDANYYIGMGRFAFDVLGQKKGGQLAEQFIEISSRFLELGDVLAEVAEASEFVVIDNAHLIEIYERYMRTRNPRLAKFLMEKGFTLLPVRPSKRVQ